MTAALKPALQAGSATQAGAIGAQPLLLTARDLARDLAVSLSTIWRMDAAGKLPKSVRVSGSVRWRRNEIIRWCEAGCPRRAEWEARMRQGEKPSPRVDRPGGDA
jgi:predicted DNA-binding transcriptional regulator AlpA